MHIIHYVRAVARIFFEGVQNNSQHRFFFKMRLDFMVEGILEGGLGGVSRSHKPLRYGLVLCIEFMCTNTESIVFSKGRKSTDSKGPLQFQRFIVTI